MIKILYQFIMSKDTITTGCPYTTVAYTYKNAGLGQFEFKDAVKKDFTDWIKNQLEIVDAIENTDFSRFPFKREGNNATLYEYVLKLETAKEICLVAGASNRANPELKRKSKVFNKH